MANLAKYVVQLEAETAKYRRQLDQANKKLERFSKRNVTALNAVRKAFLGLTAGLSTVALGRFASEQLKVLDNFAKINDRLGISVEALSELKFAAEQTGVEFRTLELGLQRLQRRAAEAGQGFGEARGAIAELGIDAAKLSQLALEQQFIAVAEALDRVEDQNTRVRLAFKLFDSEGVKVLQTLKGGAAALDEYAKKARELGAVFTEDQARAAAEARDRINELDTAFGALATNLTASVAPALADFATGINVALFGSEIQKAERQIDNLRDKLVRLLQGTGQSDSGFLGAGLGRGREIQQTIDDINALVISTGELRESLVVPPSSTNILEEVAGVKPTTLREVEQGLDGINQKFADQANVLFPDIALQSADAELALLALADANKKADEEAGKFSENFSFTFTSALEDAIVAGGKLRDVIKGLFDDIARLIIRRSITEPLVNLIGGALGPLFGGTQVSGAAANGAPNVRSGQTFLVGEKGPELFTAPRPGAIIPNGAGVGGGMVVNVDARGNENEAALVQKLPLVIAAAVRQAEASIANKMLEGRFEAQTI